MSLKTDYKMMVEEDSNDKYKHALYLFKEMRKFQKDGILCDIQIPGALEVVPAHRVVLMSARSSEGDHLDPNLNNKDQFPFYPEDDVFLVEEAYSTAEKVDSSCNKYAAEPLEQRLSALKKLWQDHTFCDVTLVTDDNHCRCDAHKVVLAACSGYFRAMFTSHMLEGEMRTIPLHEVDGPYFQKVLEFIYTGRLHNIDYEDTVKLLKEAVFYQIAPMIDWCTKFLLKNVSSAQVCLLYAIAKDLALNSLADCCCTYIRDFFTDLDEADSNVDLLSPGDLIGCLRSERLGGLSNSRTEVSVLRIVLRWLLSNAEVSPVVQNEIVSLVRFALIHPDEILASCHEVSATLLPDYIENSTGGLCHTFYCFGSVCKSHIIRALVYHERIYSQPLFQTPATSLRTTEAKLVVVDGVLAQNTVKLPSGSHRIISSSNKLQNVVRKMQYRDPFHSVVELNGFIYIIGGTRNISEGYSRVVLRYDPRLDETIAVANMNEDRGDFVACTFGDYIFVFGGRNRHGVLSSCERYDPNRNIWEFISDLPQPIYMAAGLECQGTIYISGGFDNHETVEGMLRYNPVNDTWTRAMSPMMANRGYHVMIKGHDGRLWVIGGVDNPFAGRNVWEVEAFDLHSQMWLFMGQILPVNLFQGTIRLNAMLKDGRICVFAVSNSEKFAMVEYQPDRGMWFEMKNPVEFAEIIPPSNTFVPSAQKDVPF